MKVKRNVLIIVSGELPCFEIKREVDKLKGRECKVHVVSELNSAIPYGIANVTVNLLDDYRTVSETVRSAADKADFSLKKLRTLIGERFYFMDHSLWIANETYILHFHLLRLVDYIQIAQRICASEVPDEIVCIGPFDYMVKSFLLVAKHEKIKFDHINVNGLEGVLQKFIWGLDLFLSSYPAVCCLVWFLGITLKDLLGVRGNRNDNVSVSVNSPSPTKSGNIVFLTPNLKQSDVVIQLSDVLSKKYNFNCSLLKLRKFEFPDGLAVEKLHINEMPKLSSFRDFLGRLFIRARFFKEALSLFRSKKFNKWFIHDDIDFKAISLVFFCRVIMSNLSYLVGNCRWMRKYLSVNKTSAIVTPGEWDAQSRVCVIAAKSCGVQTYSVQRGDITSFPGWGGPIFSDFMTLNGPEVKKSMVSMGVPETKLAITGDPRFDPWINNKSIVFKDKITYDELNIPKKCKIVAVMTNPVTLNEKISHTEAYINGLLDVTKNNRDLYLVIKLHPSEKDKCFYEKLRDNKEVGNVTIIRHYNTPQLLNDAAVVVTTISTTGEEAIFLGKPLVVVNLTNEPDFMPYAGSDAALTVRRRGDLDCILMSALNDQKVRDLLRVGRCEYVTKYMLSDDGCSSERCAKFIVENLF